MTIYQIQIRRGTAAEWINADPTLASGEIGFESDTNKFKWGDGTTAWTSLAYYIDQGVSTTDDVVFNSVIIAKDEKIIFDGSGGDTYFKYNDTSNKLELYVDNVKKADWG